MQLNKWALLSSSQPITLEKYKELEAAWEAGKKAN